MTLEAALITAISTLSGLVVMFGKYFYDRFEEQRKQNRECNDDRTLLFILIAESRSETVDETKSHAKDLMDEISNRGAKP